MRDYKQHLQDILLAVRKIEKYTKNLSLSKFRNNELVIDAVVRNLEVIGEASKHLPVAIKEKVAVIEWKKISGLRDILIHEYFGVDVEILWDILENKVPELKKAVQEFLKSDPGE